MERWRYPRFFCDNVSDTITITGEDAKHITKVLRLKPGDNVIVCKDGTDYFCEIKQTGLADFKDGTGVLLNVISSRENRAEPYVKVRLFQAIPKGDKMEYIIQKAVELGANEVIPFISARSVSRPNDKSAAVKHERYNRIAYEAAKQSGRAFYPAVSRILKFNEMINKISPYDNSKNSGIIFYECGGEKIKNIVSGECIREIDIFIGSEGGFEQSEVDALNKAGVVSATLGERILRCETASVAALSIIMNLLGEM